MAVAKTLTLKEKKVIDTYFSNGFVKVAALRAAGYTPKAANSLLTRYFERPQIAREVERRMEMRRAAQEASFEKQIASENEILAILSRGVRAGDILAKYKRTAPDGALYWDFTDATPEDLAVISELSTETYVEGKGEDGRTVKRFKVKHGDITTAAQLLMRAKGMLKDKLDVSAAGDLITILQQRGRQASGEKQDE